MEVYNGWWVIVQYKRRSVPLLLIEVGSGGAGGKFLWKWYSWNHHIEVRHKTGLSLPHQSVLVSLCQIWFRLGYHRALNSPSFSPSPSHDGGSPSLVSVSVLGRSAPMMSSLAQWSPTPPPDPMCPTLPAGPDPPPSSVHPPRRHPQGQAVLLMPPLEPGSFGSGFMCYDT